MTDYNVSLTSDEIEAFEAMWQKENLSASDLENHLKSLALNFISRRVEEDWSDKSLEDKKTLLGSAFSIKKE